MNVSERKLRRNFGFHYDYVEAILKLVVWMMVVVALFQYSGRHEIMLQFAKPLIFVTIVPMSVLLIAYWREINRDHEDNMAKMEMATMVREERKKGFKYKKKKTR